MTKLSFPTLFVASIIVSGATGLIILDYGERMEYAVIMGGAAACLAGILLTS